MHISTKCQLLLGVSKGKTLSQMVKKDRQDLRVCFNQAAYVLTSLRIELARSRWTYFHSLSCMREVPLPQPLTGPRITAVSPTAFSCGRGAWGNSVLWHTGAPSLLSSAGFDSGYKSSALQQHGLITQSGIQAVLPVHMVFGDASGRKAKKGRRKRVLQGYIWQ